MTKKELAFIKDEMRKFESWAAWERKQAGEHPDECLEHLEQARLNDFASSALFNLLLVLEGGSL